MRALFLHEVSYRAKPVFEMHEFPEHLASRGHEVFFLDYLEDKKGFGFSIQREEIQGRVLAHVLIKLITISPLVAGIPGRLMTAILFPYVFFRELRRTKPDVVVCYAVPTMGWQAVILCRIFRVPFVFRALDVSHKIRRTRTWPLVFLSEVVTYSLATFVMANNAALLAYCQKLGARRRRSCVVLPPLDHEVFKLSKNRRPRPIQKKSKSPGSIIVYMGSFFYFSGLKQVIESVPSMPTNSSLWLIGGGEQEHLLRRTVETLKCQDQVEFIGFVDYQSLANYFAESDVAINPMERSSVSNLALPNKVLQYMASSIPVVSTKLDGLEQTLGDAPGLFLVDEPEEVMDKVRDVLLRPDLSKLGSLNADYVRQKFSLSKSISEFEKIISTVATGRYD